MGLPGSGMRILVACECSGEVRRAFRARGHDAWSLDIKPAEDSSPFHLQMDVNYALNYPMRVLGAHPRWMQERAWDLLIAFPPCTDLAASGARWFPAKRADGRQARSLAFARMLWGAPIPRIALENPIGILSTEIRKPDQIIQPWQFGHGEVKATCLWLKGLPKLQPTSLVEGREARVWRMAPGPNRATDRSRTLKGIAEAMAAQWGGLND